MHSFTFPVHSKQYYLMTQGEQYGDPWYKGFFTLGHVQTFLK
jgi:hypothetical protein